MPKAVEARPTLSEESTKKKLSTGKIIGIVLGFLVLCCAAGAFGIYALYNKSQNGPQATTIKEAFTALSENNKEKFAKVAGASLVTDVYKKQPDGTTIADLFKGSNPKVTVVSTNISVNGGTTTAEVYFALIAEKNTSELAQYNYASLEKVGDKWILAGFGHKVAPTTADFE